MKIFIVEDDNVIANQLKEELELWNYKVILAKDLSSITEEFKSSKADLILMDLILPFQNGYHWCKEIRKFSSVPIIFLSSKGDNINKILAMEIGADDFVSKPLEVDLLIAKIKALLRRTYSFSIELDILEFNSIRLDLGKDVLTTDSSKIELTKTEKLIMESLFLAKGKIAKREGIIEKCWQSENYIDDNTLSVNITRLRRKLEDIGLKDFICTKKGEGYYLAKN